MALQRYRTRMARNKAAAFAALVLAAAGAGSAARFSTGSAPRVGVGAATETLGDFRRVPSPSRSPSGGLRRDTGGAGLSLGERLPVDSARVGGALHGRDSVDLAARADRLALAFLKKKIKKKIKRLREMVGLPVAQVIRIPMVDANPQKVSPQTHPAIPMLRTVVLLV
jgi:hypothetical protein